MNVVDKPMSKTQARVMLVIISIIWSTTGAAVRFVDWNPLVFSAFRNCVAFIFLGCVRRNFTFRLKKEILLGAIYNYLCSTFYVIALQFTAPANAIILQSTSPMRVVMISWLILKKGIKKKDLLFVFVITAGIAVFFMDGLGTGNLVGDAFALGSGILYAANLLHARYSGADVKEYNMCSYVMSMLIGFPLAFVYPPDITAVTMGSVLYLGTISMGLSSVLYAKVVPYSPPAETSMLLMLDPVLNPVWVFLLFGDVPTVFAFIGSAIVLTGVAVWIITEKDDPAKESGEPALQEEIASEKLTAKKK